MVLDGHCAFTLLGTVFLFFLHGVLCSFRGPMPSLRMMLAIFLFLFLVLFFFLMIRDLLDDELVRFIAILMQSTMVLMSYEDARGFVRELYAIRALVDFLSSVTSSACVMFLDILRTDIPLLRKS